ncbi:hypothetical protein Pfo_001084 [Paulownia fortunei]|nr:hypothetical protein Pfo_001084 [Paulownia fortunei]
MDGFILQIFLFLFFIFPVIIHSKNSCPTSSCANSFFTIKYPFKVQTDQPPKNCHDYIDLRCNDQGQALINLPSSGDFIVTFIDYYAQKIDLSDPGNCLLGRLMTNFSLYPLEAFRYENYTYYTCPRNRVRYQFSEIPCLSNSTNATIATTGFMEEIYGCKPIVGSLIPVLPTREHYYSGTFGDLQLTWNVSGCKDCEEYGAEKSGDSRSKWTKIFGSPLFIPSAVVLITFLGIACLLRLMKLILGTTANNPTADATMTELSATNTTVAPPQTTGDTPAAPAGTTNGTLGVEHSKVKSCTELVVLRESQDTSLPSTGVTCSICLEEYHAKDTVKCLPQCGHYFHAECIDQWLQKNTTCPVCRTSLSNF